MITESINRKKQFVYHSPGRIDSEQFRTQCFKEFSARILKINHLSINGKPVTIGYTKRIYDL